MDENAATEHRNSLGYVIRPIAFRARVGPPYIVWGRREDGSRVFIDAAERGGGEGLHCHCQSLPIARKGEIRAAHFAPQANEKGLCALVAANALGHFAMAAIE